MIQLGLLITALTIVLILMTLLILLLNNTDCYYFVDIIKTVGIIIGLVIFGITGIVLVTLTTKAMMELIMELLSKL